MKYLVLCLLITMALSNVCRADAPNLPADFRKTLPDTSRFHEILTVANLPSAIVALCKDGNGRIADPGGRWETTDVNPDERLPRTRLIWAMTDGRYYVVHRETGGYGFTYEVLVVQMRRGENKPIFVWRLEGSRFKDFKAFQSAVKNHRLGGRVGVGVNTTPNATAISRQLTASLMFPGINTTTFSHCSHFADMRAWPETDASPFP